MNRYRNAPGLRGPTKATPSTLSRHYSYECKVTAQERPYTSRPSRTQQLLNPKLRPQLSADVPSDSSRTKGLATEILAKLALRPQNGPGQHHHIRSARYQRYRLVDHTQDRPLAMRTMVHERAMVEQGPSLPMFLDKGRDATAMRLLTNPQSPTRPGTETLVLDRVSGRVTGTPGGGVENPARKSEAGLDTCHGIVNDETGPEVRAWITAELPGRDGLRPRRSDPSVAILLQEIIGMVRVTHRKTDGAKDARRLRPVRGVSVLTASVLR
ncbi:hypothetical protein AKAW_05641 [Aspergillus luchuensis IFO 4308]|nr:hypothetical protein AKAW_05641 [Aspergillus luchuensis IFO 4308]